MEGTRKDRWVFKSSVNPPLKYKDFHKNTDVRYDWNENTLDIKDYHCEVQVAVTVDCQSDRSFPLLMTLTANLALRGLISNEDDTSRYLFNVEKKQGNLRRFLNAIKDESFLGANIRIITFQVECKTEKDVTIKIVGNGDALGGWEPSRAIGLYRGSDVGEYTKWHVKILAEVDQTLKYKFVKESNNGSELSWELGPDQEFTVEKFHENPKERRLQWEEARRIT
ncbi:hypothetical protein Daus18300_005962 [Diaporthe australafricana]|uniref:CBM20 domain-containing protein n=1 Tax=Diaporthe australafricana TaxID=127596 RepID=A0ABR3WYE2_9PEZI